MNIDTRLQILSQLSNRCQKELSHHLGAHRLELISAMDTAIAAAARQLNHYYVLTLAMSATFANQDWKENVISDPMELSLVYSFFASSSHSLLLD